MKRIRKHAAVAFAAIALPTSTVVTPTMAFAQVTDEARPRPWWVGSCSKLQWVLVPWMCGTIEIIYW